MCGAICAAVLVAGCGGGAGSAGPTEVEKSRPEALQASRPGELLAFVKARLDRRWALSLRSSGALVSGTDVLAVAAPSSLPAYAGTTVQETGVDEDDLIKTDGQVIYALVPAGSAPSQPLPVVLTHRRLADGRIEPAGRLSIEPADKSWVASTTGMHLAPQARRLALVGQGWRGAVPGEVCLDGQPCPSASLLPFRPYEVVEHTSVDLLNADDPAALKVQMQMSIDGHLVGSRRIGDALVLVTQWTPRLAVDALPPGTAQAERDALLARLGTGDVLPTLRINGGPSQPLVAETDCWLQPANASTELQISVITVIDLGSPAFARRSRCFAGGSEAIYMSSTTLVLATTRFEVALDKGVLRYPDTMSTDVHKFALGTADVEYRGSGNLPGHLGWVQDKKPYRMSEYGGDLRIVTFTGPTGWAVPLAGGALPATPASPATLSVLRERPSDRSLQVLAQLPNASRPQPLGHAGEQIYAVRFFGERAYLVTFRQTDPLYVLDLGNPADPKAVGELAIPGYSDWLYPLANGLLFGVGRQASDSGVVGGIKVGLFDVADPARPTELASRTLGVRGSASTLDYSSHGLNLFTQGAITRLALPMFVMEADPAQSRRGLQRFEVDAQARTLTTRPMLGVEYTTYGDSGNPLWAQRSVQIGGQVYLLAGARLTGWDW